MVTICTRVIDNTQRIWISRQEGSLVMWDVGCVIAGILFFLIAIAYTNGCDRLGTKEGK
jgi:hypothetical protein